MCWFARLRMLAFWEGDAHNICTTVEWRKDGILGAYKNRARQGDSVNLENDSVFVGHELPEVRSDNFAHESQVGLLERPPCGCPKGLTIQFALVSLQALAACEMRVEREMNLCQPSFSHSGFTSSNYIYNCLHELVSSRVVRKNGL